MTYPKRLIEVDLPIARISAHARREKSIRHGHISTLHIWWARRPLAACRAVICAALWPDPADPLCPQAFRDKAVGIITAFAKRFYPEKITEEQHTLWETASEESQAKWKVLAGGAQPLDPTKEDHLHTLRHLLLDFIADFANWDNSTVPAYLETSRALTQAAHEALGGEPGTRPLVVDPFAGGGSIPLEALRVGADAFASDLNPVAVLLNKVVLEYIPKYGQKLAEEVRKWGQWIKEQAEKELAEFYPKDPDGATPIAYLWARTIRCEGPGCGAVVPLIRTNNLFVKGKKHVSLEPVIDRNLKTIDFKIGSKTVPFSTIQSGTVTCPICSYTTPNKRVMSQLIDMHGGATSSVLIAIVSISKENGRTYRIPEKNSYSSKGIQEHIEELARGGEQVPKVKVNPNRPSPNARGLSAVTRYGMAEFQNIYSLRQRLALLCMRKLISIAINKVEPTFRRALGSCLTLAYGRLIDRNTTLCRWIPQTGAVGYTFGRQALSMIWDYAEINILSHSGGWNGAINDVATTIESNTTLVNPGQAEQFSATSNRLATDQASAFVTDPPYYDAIPYADLSDFFYVWLKPLIALVHSDLAQDETTPKEEEAIWNPGRKLQNGKPKDQAFYENQMQKSLAEGCRITMPSGIGVVVFAHKSTAGWEALLAGMLQAGWIVTASWPVDTEREARTNAIGTASLASSVHLICRPREDTDGKPIETVGDWRDVLSELPKRMHEWMPRLTSEGVVGADAIFACLGPALEIFSRYSRVEKANGDQVMLKEYLEQVWAAVSKEALSTIFRDANAAGLEPDARLTAMWLWTLGGPATVGTEVVEEEEEKPEEEEEEKPTKGKMSSAGFTLEYDTARKIAQGLGINLEQLTTLVEVKGDKARMLPVAERAQALFGKKANLGETTTGRKKKSKQGTIFDLLGEGEGAENAGMAVLGHPDVGSTVLDRVHQAMLLFAAGRGEMLKRFLVEDGVGKDARFWKLADNLNKLYPPGIDERRWIEGVLARKKGLGQ